MIIKAASPIHVEDAGKGVQKLFYKLQKGSILFSIQDNGRILYCRNREYSQVEELHTVWRVCTESCLPEKPNLKYLGSIAIEHYFAEVLEEKADFRWIEKPECQ